MMTVEFVSSPLLPWQNGSGDFADIVIDSRIRAVRNLKKYIFPDKASDTELAAVLDEGKRSMPGLNTMGTGRYEYIDIAALDPLERELLASRHFSSAAHIAKPEQRGLLLREDGAAAVMINEEDHFCIQTAAAGLNLQKVWEEASQIDDTLESRLNFASRDDFGYLTASPSMTGTGCIAGVTIHVPALILMKRFNRIVQGITKFGFAVGGIHGERNDLSGNVFQITNQITLGVSESDILEQLRKIVTQIVQEERNCRDVLWNHNSHALKDKCQRSYGMLANAWLMSRQEALSRVSDLRFGIDLGIIAEAPLAYEALMTAAEPAFLQAKVKKELPEEELERQRAKAIQNVLSAYAVPVT